MKWEQAPAKERTPIITSSGHSELFRSKKPHRWTKCWLQKGGQWAHTDLKRPPHQSFILHSLHPRLNQTHDYLLITSVLTPLIICSQKIYADSSVFSRCCRMYHWNAPHSAFQQAPWSNTINFLAFSIFLYWQIKLSSCSEDNKFPFLPLQKFHITKSACFPHCFIRTWNTWCQPWKFPEVSILFDICLSIWRKIIHNYELFVLNSSSKYTLTDSHSNLSAVCKPSIFQHAHKICIVSPH